MTDFNAHVTGIVDGSLSAGSHVRVLTDDGVKTAAVPERSEVGGILFWHRVNDALATIGWRVAGSESWEQVGDVIRFRVEPAS